MDVNQKDLAALKANLCPDCGHTIGMEIGPWCKTCDVWFDIDTSGWIIRNTEATKYYELYKAEYSHKKEIPADEKREAVHRKRKTATSGSLFHDAKPSKNASAAQSDNSFYRKLLMKKFGTFIVRQTR